MNKRFVAVRVDTTKPGNPDEHLLDPDSFNTAGLPTVAILDSSGNYLSDKTIGAGEIDVESLDATEYLEILKTVP